MTKNEVLTRLRDLCKLAEEPLNILEQDQLSDIDSEHLRSLVPRLKREISSEYKRTSPLTVQENMGPEESAYYLPAIREAYADTGLSTLRAEAKPRKDWYEVIEAVNAKLSHYCRQLESRR